MVSHKWTYNGSEYEMYAWNKDCSVYGQWKKYNTFQEIIGLEKIRDLKLKNRVIDVGANVGNHAIYFAAECMLPVDAYEPVSQHYYCLNINVQKNPGGKLIETFPMAVSNNDRNVRLNYGKQAPENVWTTHEEDADVLAISIDSFYCGHENIDLIKLDIEGTEMTVLIGAEETIKRCKPYLFIEVCQPHKYDMINAYLCRFGYKDLYGNVQPEGADTRIWGAR